MMKDNGTQPEQQMAETQSQGQAPGAEPSEPVPVTASIPSTQDTTTHVAQAPRPTYLEPVDPRSSNPSTHVAQTSPAKPQTDTASAAENLAYYIARLEAEMENLDDSVSSARVEQLIAADVRLQQLVNRIVKGQVEQAVNELKKDSTAQYINF